MQDKQSLIQDIRSGKIDINNQELFFSILIKGLMTKLDDNIKIRGIEIPHIILHTGDSTIYQFETNKNHSGDISSMEEIYNIIPRCMGDFKVFFSIFHTFLIIRNTIKFMRNFRKFYDIFILVSPMIYLHLLF